MDFEKVNSCAKRVKPRKRAAGKGLAGMGVQFLKKADEAAAMAETALRERVAAMLARLRTEGDAAALD